MDLIFIKKLQEQTITVMLCSVSQSKIISKHK